MKTVGEIKGYTRLNRQKWRRGCIMFSAGRQWIDNDTFIECIVKTNLDTNEMSIASLKEHKKFLTPEAYKEYMLSRFQRLTKEGLI